MAISQYHIGYHESSGETVTAFPRLPRPLLGLAMTTRLAASLNFSICLSLHNLNPPAPAEYRI